MKKISEGENEFNHFSADHFNYISFRKEIRLFFSVDRTGLFRNIFVKCLGNTYSLIMFDITYYHLFFFFTCKIPILKLRSIRFTFIYLYTYIYIYFKDN